MFEHFVFKLSSCCYWVKFKNILGSGQKESIENIQSDFVTLASHQLRTPLSGIKWYVELLLAERDAKLSDKQRHYLKEVYRSNERAIHLVNDLLDVSRIQEGHIHLEYRSTKVEQVIQDIIDSLSTLLRSNKVRINFEIINGPLPPVNIDSEKLKRVVINLLSNSIKYSPDEGEIRLTVEQGNKELKISVEDSGVGIPKIDQKKVFNKFFRSINVIKLVPDGSGLSLFIAKSLIEAMGGRIWFESEEGRGTTFYFTLPVD